MSLLAQYDASKITEEENIGRAIRNSRHRRIKKFIENLETEKWDSMQKQQSRKKYQLWK